MADITNYPEMTDELLQRYIAQAMQQAMKPADTSSPLSAGLLSAGLAMMAGSRGRSFGEALGQGGLLGLQAYGGAKEAQRKDPMQMINLLTAMEGLREQKAGRDWMKGFTPTTGQEPLQFSPAPGMPADVQQRGRGMFDRGGDPLSMELGQMQPPPSVGGYQVPANTPGAMSNVWGGIGMPGRAGKVADKMLDIMTKAPTFASPGQTGFTTDVKTLQPVQGRTLANLDKGMREGPGGGAEMIPDYDTVAAKIATATTGAAEAAKAAQDVIQIPDGKGGMISVPRAQAVKMLGPQAAPQGLPPELTTAWGDYVKGGGPENGLPFKVEYMPKPQAQLGRAPSKAEEASALAPITQESEYQKGLITQNLKIRERILEEEKAARTQSANIDRFMQLAKDPNVVSGKLAETFSGLKGMAGSFGVDIKGRPAEEAMNSITNEMALQLRSPASGAGMPGAMSDGDRDFLKVMPPGLTQMPGGRELIAETFQTVNNRKMEVSRLMLKHEMEGGKIDTAFLKKMQDYADKNPLFGEEQQKKLERIIAGPTEPFKPKVTGATLDYHIKNIMETGTEKEKERLRKSGLVQ